MWDKGSATPTVTATLTTRQNKLSIKLQSVIISTECRDWVDEIIVNTMAEFPSSNSSSIRIQPLTESNGGNLGFCNSIFIVLAKNDTSLFPVGMLKLYSELAQARMQVSTLDPLDTLLGDLGLGPKVYGISKSALFMEYFQDGIVLTEEIVHSSSKSNDHRVILEQVARSLAQLHTLNTTSRTFPNTTYNNMLWDSIDVLLDRIDNSSIRSFFQTQVEFQRAHLESLDLPLASVGHGDFKPSNVVMLPTNTIRFIDLETTGLHYRAYDLAKFFRTRSPTKSTSGNQEYFLRCYLDECHECDGSKSNTISPASILTLLQLESQLLIPMTWLEAAIFFHASRQPIGWKLMADDRLSQYRTANVTFAATIKAYQQARQTLLVGG